LKATLPFSYSARPGAIGFNISNRNHHNCRTRFLACATEDALRNVMDHCLLFYFNLSSYIVKYNASTAVAVHGWIGYIRIWGLEYLELSRPLRL